MAAYDDYDGVEFSDSFVLNDWIDDFVDCLKEDVEYTLKNEGLSDEEILESDIFNESLFDFMDAHFIYDNDAFEYLKDTFVTDFSDAIDEWGAKDVISIAHYYFEQDIYNYIDQTVLLQELIDEIQS